MSKRIVERQASLRASRAKESNRLLKVVAEKAGSKVEGEQNLILSRTGGVGKPLDPTEEFDVHLEYGAMRTEAEMITVRESRTTKVAELGPCLQSALGGARGGEVVRIACQPGAFLAVTGLPPVVFPGEMVMVTARLTLPNTVPDKTKSD